MDTLDEVKTFLHKKVNLFCESETSLRQSLLRNSHMNNYDERIVLRIDNVKTLLHSLVDEVRVSSTMCISILNELVVIARMQPRTDVTDAVIVGFVNHVAMSWGIDYGMYTSDLR